MAIGFGEVCALVCTICWASAVVLLKKSGESLAPFALNYFKNLLALLLLVITLVWWPGSHWPQMPTAVLAVTLLSGILGIAIADTLYFQALNALGAARMGIVGMAFSPSVIVLAAVFLGERLNAMQLLGVAFTLLGIALVSYQPRSTPIAAVVLRSAVMVGGLSVGVMAVGVVMVKPILADYDFLGVLTLRVLAGVLAMTLMIVLQKRGAALWASYKAVRHWPQVISGSVMGTYVSMIFWLLGYKYASASVAAVLNELSAVFILLFAAYFLREKFTARQGYGSVLAGAGVLLVVIAKN